MFNVGSFVTKLLWPQYDTFGIIFYSEDEL